MQMDMEEVAMDKVRKQVEMCDKLHAFEIVRSMTGGIATGFGSTLITNLKEQFGDGLIAEFQVYPPLVSTIELYN